MILQALVALKREIPELQGDDAFEQKRVDFVIVVDRAGRFISIESQRGEDGKGRLMKIPRMPKRTVAVTASMLVDNAKYVLALDDLESDKPARPARLLEMRDAFRERIIDAGGRIVDEGLSAVMGFYEAFDANLPRLLADRPRAEWNGSELIAFRLADDIEPVHLRPAVAADCSSARARGEADGGDEVASDPATTKKGGKGASARMIRCLVTGEISQAERLHPALKRVPGGQSSGTSLVAFNAKAFESHGLSQGDNAPVSAAAATAYGDVLNWMLAEDPTLGWKRPHRYGVRLGDDTVVLFWAKGSREVMDAFAMLANLSPTPHEAIMAAESAWKGLLAASDELPFYALTLGGNAARAVVRDWFTTSLAQLRKALGQYFDDLALPAPDDREGTRPLPISLLVKALDPPGNASVPPGLNAKLFRASIDINSAVPREVLRLALLRLRVPPAGDKREKRSPAEMFHARSALIKAALRGIARRTQDPERRKQLEVTMALDPDNTNPGYVLGRLFAVLERLQGAALPELNATIRDRYFGAASTRPASVFGSLLSLSTKHLSKLGGGLEHYFDERLRAVTRQLDGRGMPSHLSLEDQGLFAIGYFHERDSLLEDARTRSEKRKLADAPTTA